MPDQNSDVDEGQEEKEKEEKEGSGGSWLIHHSHTTPGNSYTSTPLTERFGS